MAAKSTKKKKTLPSLSERFAFIGDAVAPGNRAALKSAVFVVEDRLVGAQRTLKLWRKTGTPVDEDLRRLWLHEMRQIQRVMAYTGARELIVDILEFVEDPKEFGVLLERVGRPLAAQLKRVNQQHWLKNLSAARPRMLFWRNVRRLVAALGIVHAQSLVHGSLTAESVMTDGANDPDFKLGGFEWSLWFGATTPDKIHAKLGPAGTAKRAPAYSFAEDWRCLGDLIADCLNVQVKPSGDVISRRGGGTSIVLNVSERMLLKRLIAPSRLDLLDVHAISRSVDDVIASLARSATTRSGSLILGFSPTPNLGEVIYDASGGAIAVDEFRQQLEWVRADLDAGPTMLIPRRFDPATGILRLVTENMVYQLRAYREDGAAVWDIAVCRDVRRRESSLRHGDDDDHIITQPVVVLSLPREAEEERARLGPDALDWSAFGGARGETEAEERSDAVGKALLLVQVAEAVVKALEIYPIEILHVGREEGRRYAIIRAQPGNERDRLAKRIGMADSATALKRLFDEDRRDAEGKWRISPSNSLGTARAVEVVVSFTDLADHNGRNGYRFEIDEELPAERPLFLRAERDTGTEQVIGRRLRNIKALTTRVDLAEMLEDPWRVRRSSRETISEEDQKDAGFKDLDEPKQRALVGLWSTLPAFFVVGPPGVGKTKLATETVRRRFSSDKSARMLLTAQGHDALDNLQDKIKKVLEANDMGDVIVVRSTTPDQRPTTDEEVQLTSLVYLKGLAQCELFEKTVPQIRDRIRSLASAAERFKQDKNSVSRDERSGLNAISSLVLDGANIVISTLNSPDIERLVEAREQFDWVVVEEAAKATGPEIVGSLMLSGRRLMIGDHHQLPPFEAERLVTALGDHSLVEEMLKLAEPLIGSLMRDGELDELNRVAVDSPRLRNVASLALKLLEPFRSFVEEDERRALGNPTHRSIAATLTEQRRMDPAISEIVSKAFYGGRLKTEAKRAAAAETDKPPFMCELPLPESPVVVVDFEHVSSTGRSSPVERGKPRWHNPSEVNSVIDVLRHIRAAPGSPRPTLAILAPYKAQVDRLHERITALRASDLAHLSEFAPVRVGHGFVGTVDSFQGSEADLVILSLVRNNPRAGTSALGFLRDRRRMNVALSRAKSKLVIVGSLSFLREAVRGVNPDAETHDLSFLTIITDVIADLCTQKRGDDQRLAAVVTPDKLRFRG